MEEQQQRPVLLTNRLALILFILNLVAILAVVGVYAWTPIVPLILVNNLAYAGVLVLNHFKYSNSSRLLLSLFLPLSTLGITIAAKLMNPAIDEFSYFSSRVVMLVASILPLILFRLREKTYLYTGLVASALCLFLYDFFHQLFGVGYYQLGFDSPGYSFFTIVLLMLYVLLVSGFLYYKKMLEKAERELSESHEQLKHFFAELGMQHEEIHAQADKLQENQQQLQEANQLIEQQKRLLQAENLELHEHLLEKNKILEASNQELHSRLDELRQFSYTISHNLRGPVANLLGLSSLFDLKNALPKNRELILHTRTAAAALDAVIRDLSQVLQLRDAKDAAETIDLNYLLKNVLLSIETEGEADTLRLESKLQIAEIQGVKPYLHSILYNLLSNAIKYYHPERSCQITISTRKDRDGVLLAVQDNGIGIDLEKHGNNLFKMYKRFHEYREGRGLGLYLIKTQAEILGGYVEVQSQPGVGTTFSVWLPQPRLQKEQVQNKPLSDKA